MQQLNDSDKTINKLIKILFLLFLIFVILFLASEFLIPITIAGILSFLLLPLVQKFEKLGVSKIISILICLTLIILLLSVLIFLILSQISDFTDHIVELEVNAKKKLDDIMKFVESITMISYERQMRWIMAFRHELMSRKGFQRFFLFTTSFFENVGLIIIYIFCFLYYRNKLYNVFVLLFPNSKHKKAEEELLKIQKVSTHYFSGVLTVMVILGTMHSIGLLLLGIKHAIFFGYLASLFILVPFVGTMIGSSIPILIALLTKDSVWYAVGVAGIFSFNLFIESQLLTPMIVGSHIRINPMAIIFAIVIGGFIWGFAGMVLFIPLLGILKIVADQSDGLNIVKVLLSESSQPNRFQWLGKLFKK
jgi:predicted PurR-regulated permease PerM